MASRRKFIASGSYGCVVAPALPNGEREFPNQVTKLYFDRQSQSSMNAAAYAVATNTKLGDMGFRRLVFPYTETRRFDQLPEELQTLPGNSCRLEYRKASDKPIGMTHMPNLGIDFIEIRMAYDHSLKPESEHHAQGIALIKEIRAVPLEIVLEKGVKAMLKSLEILNRNGKIHRDIRLENTMFDPTTGVMTLIDFDLMTGKANTDELTKWAIPPNLMMAYPPEMAFWNTIRHRKLNSPPDFKKIDDTINHLLNYKLTFTDYTDDKKKDTIRTFLPLIGIWKGQLLILTDLYKSQASRSSLSYLFELSKRPDSDITKFLLSGMGYYMDDLSEQEVFDTKERRERIRDMSIDTIDSYCMSLCLMMFLGVYLDDAKWAEHGVLLDQLFETILIPLYKFSMYETRDRRHTRSRIQDVMGAIGALYEKVENPSKKRINHPPNNDDENSSKPPPSAKQPRVEGGTRKKLKSVRRTKKGRRRA